MKNFIIGLGILSMTIINNVNADCSSLYYKKAKKRNKSNNIFRSVGLIGGGAAIGGGLGAAIQSGSGHEIRDGFVPGAIAAGIFFAMGALVTSEEIEYSDPEDNTYTRVYTAIENAKKNQISYDLYRELNKTLYLNRYSKPEQDRILFKVIDLINDENRVGGELCNYKNRGYKLVKFKHLIDLIERNIF